MTEPHNHVSAGSADAEYIKAFVKELRKEPRPSFRQDKKAADLIETLYLMTLGAPAQSVGMRAAVEQACEYLDEGENLKAHTVLKYALAQPSPADTVEMVPETCHDCGVREPCDEDCPNYIEPESAHRSSAASELADLVTILRCPDDISIQERLDAADAIERLEGMVRDWIGAAELASERAIRAGARPTTQPQSSGVWHPIETAPRDGTPIEACNTRHPSHAPVIVRWDGDGLSDDLPEPHWCDAATRAGDALYYNQNYFDFWKPTSPLPRPEHS